MSDRGRLKEIAARALRLLMLCVKGLTEPSMSKAEYVLIRSLTGEMDELAEDLPK